MKEKKNITSYLNQAYFWDADISSGKGISKRMIIERVFNFGSLDEIRFLLDYYGEEETIDVLRNLNFIDSKTLNFISRFFRNSKKEFKCYTRKQSKVQHWSS